MQEIIFLAARQQDRSEVARKLRKVSFERTGKVPYVPKLRDGVRFSVVFIFRIKSPTIAVTHETGSPTLITVEPGTEIRTRKAGPQLPDTGMVDVEIMPQRKVAAMFMQDLRRTRRRDRWR